MTYSEKLLKKTAKVSSDTLKKSGDLVKKLTHPGKKTSLLGIFLGRILSVFLIFFGLILVLFSRKEGYGSIIAGIISFISGKFAQRKVS